MKSNLKKILVSSMILLSVSIGPASAETGMTCSLKEHLETLGCSLFNCPGQLFKCLLESKCRQTLSCNNKCQGAAQQQACHLACLLDKGKHSKVYGSLVQCMGENQCLPRLPPDIDGICPVTEENIDKIYIFSSLDEIEGIWLEVRGLNCGVSNSGWEGGYDALPCRTSSWLYKDDAWWYHTSFCGPFDGSDCGEKKPMYFIASPSLSGDEAGLMHMSYVNSALKPHNERWYVLSKPHTDWFMYTYCGSTPAGEYAGVNIATKTAEPWIMGIPDEVEDAFRKAAHYFNFAYDSMCTTEHELCPTVTAHEDIEEYLLEEDRGH